MDSYSDTDENWHELILSIQNCIKDRISYIDIAAMAVNKANTAAYNNVLYALSIDCIERESTEKGKISIEKIKKCVKEVDDIKNGVAYDVYHLIFDNQPDEVLEYIPNENDFVKKVKDEQKLEISAPLVACNKVDYQIPIHYSLNYRVTKSIFCSEKKLKDRVEGTPTDNHIKSFLEQFCFGRELFAHSHMSKFGRQSDKSTPTYCYIDIPKLTEIFVEKLKGYVAGKERARLKYNYVRVENVSLFIFINSVEDMADFVNAYWAVKSVVLLSCPSDAVQKYIDKCQYGREIIINAEDNKLSSYDRQDEIKLMIKMVDSLPIK